jgi:3-hydroxymyristoyl/3-hydroxydecanoyl-(acyl carrier protein) dehydratase
MSALQPLLGDRDLSAPLAWQAGRPISAATFLVDARALAAQLPQQGPAVNLCQDRYHFALGLAAALMRGHTSLMPPNALPETLGRLEHGGAAPYALVDDSELDLGGLQRVTVQAAGRTDTDQPVDPGAVPALPAELDAVCLLTSGSTGAPQPHRKQWLPLVQNIDAEARRLAEMLGRPSLQGLNIVATVPPQHSYGFESSVLLALLGGAAFDSGRPFYPADIAAALERLPRPRALVTTPFHLKTLLLSGVALPAVDLVLSATAPLSPQLAQEAEQRLSATLIEIYGCTEAGQVASRRTTEGEVWQALGELRLWREQVGDDERFLVAGGHVTADTPLADMLELLDERRFRLLGRANDLIHVAGKRSSLAHLNFHLNRIEGVRDGAFWLPEDVADGVVRPVAFVVAPGLSAREVITGLRQRVEAAFVPRRVVLLDSLPHEATGKITAATLRTLAARHLTAEAAPAARPSAAAPLAGGPADAENLATLKRQPTTGIEIDNDNDNDNEKHADADNDAEFDIGADHPAFEGHFPGQPILPGVVLLSLVLQALVQKPAFRQQLGATPVIDAVKFMAPVQPGTRLRVALSAQGRGVGFDIWDAARCVARGKLGPAVDAA